MSFPISLDVGELRWTLRQSIDLAGRMGFDAVQLPCVGDLAPGNISRTALLDLRKFLSDRRLSVSALTFRTQHGYDVLLDLDRRVEATKTLMQTAYELGAPVVLNRVGRIPTGEDSPGWPVLTEVLAEMGRHGQQCGSILTLETGAEPIEAWRRLLDALPEESIGLSLNPGELQASGSSPLELLEQFGASIQHVYAADGQRDPIGRSGRFIELGGGAVDFHQLIGLLAEHGYRGAMTIAPLGRADLEAELVDSLRFLRSLR
jgi:sugar phosphate isomerase/epimerase